MIKKVRSRARVLAYICRCEYPATNSNILSRLIGAFWRHAHDVGCDRLQLDKQVFNLIRWHIDGEVTMDHCVPQLRHFTTPVSGLVFYIAFFGQRWIA